ncbi:uncharacterized protein FIBRA_05090 [Fibroporia radiculosa]|uniref:Kinesin-like protein n=1 Tax=Fibroporia radiculosa TaxID=599839 RepID=J4GQD4_9APHY|nr:uncharacterized protein FIBRA_05090 [Fibroporia radiculosa]CCM02975.1 predicted protein [Fibroporia radiculosa]
MASSAALTTTHLPQLRAELADWRQKQPSQASFTTSLPVSSVSNTLDTTVGKNVIVAFRTRPPLENEAETKFSVFERDLGENAPESADQEEEDLKPTDVAEGQPAFCAGISVTAAEPGEFVAHVPGWKWNGPTLTHKRFSSDIAFGPDVENEEVYQRTVVAHEFLTLALSGGIACILAYGQTGSGKTFTIEALEQRVARDLFTVSKVMAQRLRDAERRDAAQSDAPLDEAEGDIFEFSATFLELLGKRAVDLLESVDGLSVDSQGHPIRTEVVVQENKAGEVRPKLVSTVFRSSDELGGLIATALSHRRTSATARNARSSRSHAILTIRIKNKLLPYADDGQLILVDLAGSERYEDSKRHDKQRMTESKENNTSLMNLKDCVRAKAKMANEDGFVHIPWRMNKLTILLKSIFDPESRQTSKTLIIAHVSPHIQDCTHSVNTLSYASPFKTSPPKAKGPAPYDPTDPRTWNTVQTQQWLKEEFTKRARTRLAAAYKVKEKDVRARVIKLPPPDMSAPVVLAVDVEKLCPEGMTATHFGRMYTTEFVQRVMELATFSEENAPHVVRSAAAEVVGSLTYLLLTAKTRTRKEIMKSRKKLTLDATYGEVPTRMVVSAAGADVIQVPECRQLRLYSDEEIQATWEHMGKRWTETIDTAMAEADAEHENTDDARVSAIVAMLDAWRALAKQGAETV